MSSLNKVQLIGNLGSDPEVRYTGNGTAVTSLSIATSEKWTDKQSGEKQERTEWHNVTLWARLAEVAGEYLNKGSKVYVEGQLRTDKYTDKDGIERYSTKVIGQQLIMLGSKQDDQRGGSQQRQGGGQRQQGGGRGGASNDMPRQQPASDDFSDDDIPFQTTPRVLTRRT